MQVNSVIKVNSFFTMQVNSLIHHVGTQFNSF